MFIKILFCYFLLSELIWFSYYIFEPRNPEPGEPDKSATEFLAGMFLVPLLLPFAILNRLLNL